MNRAARRAQIRTDRRAGRRGRVAALGSAAVLATAGAGAAVLAAGAPAGANAPIVVDTLDDTAVVDGVTSLREAILLANTTPGADEITFAVTGTIDVLSDLPPVYEALTITGPGAADLVVDGGDAYHLLQFVSIDGTVGDIGVSGLTLTHGVGTGFGGNGILVYGGTADFTADHVTVVANTNGSGYSYGGGILVLGSGGPVTATVTNSVIADNVADQGGGVAFAGQVDGTIADTVISGNTATIGGGVFVYSYGATSLIRTVVRDNEAASAAGGIASAFGESLTVTDSTVSGNTAGQSGGGVYSASSLVMTGSTVSGNHAGEAGGGITVSGDSSLIANSTVSGNTAAHWVGGIHVYGPTTILQSTITGNAVTEPSGGPEPVTGGIELHSVPLVGSVGAATERAHGSGGSLADHLTGPVAAVVRGSGTAPASVPVAPSLTVTGSIVDGNGGTDIVYYQELVPSVVLPTATVTADHSVLGSVDPGVTFVDAGGNQRDVPIAAVALGPLADNGGPTLTHALGAGSVAIDAGPNPVPTFPGNAYDQRGVGYARVSGSTVDVGAVEDQVPEPRFTG